MRGVHVLKVLAIIIGAGCMIVGSVMTYRGIRTEGWIELKSAVVSGTINVGLAGLILCFLGLILILAAVLKRVVVETLVVTKVVEATGKAATTVIETVKRTSASGKS